MLLKANTLCVQGYFDFIEGGQKEKLDDSQDNQDNWKLYSTLLYSYIRAKFH